MCNLKKFFLAALCLPVLFAGQNLFAKGIQDEIDEEQRAQERAQEHAQERVYEHTQDRESEYAEMRPEIRALDELMVVFSMQEVELDFRKSYYAPEAQIYTGLYEGLFSYNPITVEPVPAAAERWVLSEDKMQWTFTIRRNARFSNGDPLRAEDFRAAWLSIIAPDRNSPHASMFDVIEGARSYRNGTERDINKVGIIAQDDRTLIVKLNAPAAFFPAMLCHHSFSPVHPSLVNNDNWTYNRLISNGPYRVTSLNNQSMVLVKNEHYWDTNIALNKITIRFARDGNEAASLWNSGEARWIAGEVNFDALTDRSGIQVNVLFCTQYFFIRSADKPWNDHRIRRAMALVLPWREIRSGYFLPAETLIFPISGYPKVTGITDADYEEARRLMTEAGYENGAGMPELVIRLTPSEDAARVGRLMAAAWKEILGINVRVEVYPFDRYYQSLKDENYNVGFITWIGDFADPYTFLQMWLADSNLNDARLNDPDYDALIDRSMREEGAERFETLAEAEQLLLDRGVVLPVYYGTALNIIDLGEVDGWYPNAMDIHPFKYLSFKGYRPLPGVVMVMPTSEEVSR